MADTLNLAPDTIAPVIIQAGKAVEDVIVLKVAGQAIAGWSQVKITRGIESVPSRFEIGMSAALPADGVIVKEGAACEVLIGKSKVVTGWIDRVRESGSSGSHDLQVAGRGLCADLVDCSAEWKGGQIVAANALQLASKLASPYDIQVYAASGANLGPTIPQFNLNFGETAYELIERATRYAGLLAYEDEEGGLVLAQAGSAQSASGLVYGQNVETYAVDNSQDGRFSDYVCSGLSVDTLGDFGTDGGLFFYQVKDPNITRHRLTYLVAESVSDPYEFCRRRADWQMNRSAGRGTRVDVTTDSWRDAGGTLWTPNTLVPVDVPGLRLANKTLLLAEVTYRYGDEGGTLADLTLMPREAFLLEPIQLQPALADIPRRGWGPMRGLLSRLLNMVRLGRVTAIDDAGPVQRLQVTEASPGPDGSAAVVDKVAALGLFGLASVPPLKSDVLVLRLFGGRSLTIAIATNHQPSRLRDLSPGDSALYDERGAFLKMTAEGPILDCAGLALKIRNFSTFVVDGDVQATGDFIGRCEAHAVSLNTVADDYDAHKHPVIAVGAPTGLTDHPLP